MRRLAQTLLLWLVVWGLLLLLLGIGVVGFVAR
jgi:hypothetical protein